ncbi:glycosyltransferase, partial [Aquicoccus sp. SCR17]|nr:glycosyltransferase [Carideicomes alvinocaridis]
MDHPGGVDAPSVCIAIPARNEAEEIIGCLEAIAACTGAAPLGLVVFVNNSTDATARKAREWGRSAAPSGLAVTVCEEVLPAREASAGRARALAMARARACLPESGLLLTTDADSRPAPGWVREMVAALATCDLALGPIAPRPGASHARLRIYDRIEREALALQARILQRDGAEAHQHVSGASLGLRASAWDRLGGLPDVPCGEDRAL